MYCWEWHDFIDQTDTTEEDEHDPYSAAADIVYGEYITRDFWVGSAKAGYSYTIAFQRIPIQPLLESVVGADFEFQGQKIAVPDSGGWLINFNLSDAGLDFDRVELNHRPEKSCLPRLLVQFMTTTMSRKRVYTAGMPPGQSWLIYMTGRLDLRSNLRVSKNSFLRSQNSMA